MENNSKETRDYIIKYGKIFILSKDKIPSSYFIKIRMKK